MKAFFVSWSQGLALLRALTFLNQQAFIFLFAISRRRRNNFWLVQRKKVEAHKPWEGLHKRKKDDCFWKKVLSTAKWQLLVSLFDIPCQCCLYTFKILSVGLKRWMLDYLFSWSWISKAAKLGVSLVSEEAELCLSMVNPHIDDLQIYIIGHFC